MGDKKLNTFQRIREIVKQIPRGYVTTYGQIAKLAGTKDARKVGWALCKNQDPEIPCHRVLKKDGFLVENYAFGDWQDEKAKLIAEGVEFVAKKQVDMERFAWKQ